MKNEINYTKSVGPDHIKTFGQYFTQYKVADFMCSWVCTNATSMLDPAVGNSVFFTYARKYNNHCKFTGYEIDKKILDFFGNPTDANIINEDYLLNGWDDKYDAIVCNPPYSRFQAVSNRNEIIESIYMHTGNKYSGYTNLYSLFLIKSIFQLSETGRLAYIIPSEFLNSKYGIAIKQLLIDEKLLRAIINFKNDNEIFFNATTTCCILLLDHEPKTKVSFYNLTSINELTKNIITDKYFQAVHIEYDRLSATDKWRSYINQEETIKYTNLKPVTKFCSVSRGIATGANDFFCFSLSKAKEYEIPEKCLTKCVCRSADIKSPIFNEIDFKSLSDLGKTVYLLDVTIEDYEIIKSYILKGESVGVNKKYLLSHRSPWYSMEQKMVAPIWVSSACRENIKFVRNLAKAKCLTTFHSVFVNEDYSDDIDVIFCYFLTPVAQTIIRQNRKELGNGLEKFQPNDLNTAKMLDINIISDQDRLRIMKIYNEMLIKYDVDYIAELNNIFSTYLEK